MTEKTYVYALALDAPGRYVIGQSTEALTDIQSAGGVTLRHAAHLTVLKEQSILTPLEVLDAFHARLDSYLGFGELNETFRLMYESWLEMRLNPPNFEVEEDE